MKFSFQGKRYPFGIMSQIILRISKVERVSGESFKDFCEENIFRPFRWKGKVISRIIFERFMKMEVRMGGDRW